MICGNSLMTLKGTYPSPEIRIPETQKLTCKHLYLQTVVTWGDSRYIGRPWGDGDPAEVEGIPSGEIIDQVEY